MYNETIARIKENGTGGKVCVSRGGGGFSTFRVREVHVMELNVRGFNTVQ